MASVSIRLRTGDGAFEIEMDHPETWGQAFADDKSHLDSLVDEAVARIKRAYRPEPTEEAK